jgi:hypothetical protein
MKNGKITIEIPAGKTDEEVKEILKNIADTIVKSMPRRRIEEAERLLRNSTWPEDIEEVLNGSVLSNNQK